jgi:hypothetical protein
LGRLADFKRIHPDWLGNILELGCAKVAHDEIKASPDLPIGIFREADRARLGDTFQSRGNIDAVAHQVPVVLLNHIAEMDADAKLDATLGRKTGVALHHAVLHLDSASHSINYAAELDNGAIASALDNSPIVDGDYWVDQIAPQRTEPGQCPILVGTSKPAVSDHIRYQDRGEFPPFGHGSPPSDTRLAQPSGQNFTEFVERSSGPCWMCSSHETAVSAVAVDVCC